MFIKAGEESWYAMSFSDSNYELVELTDDAKQKEGKNYIERPYYRDHPTKAVAVLTFGETREEFWIQQRPPEDCKPLHWEIVAGSKSSEHDSMREAAQEEIREELFGNDLSEAPEEFNLNYLGKVYKETDNPQELHLFSYESGRSSFPESDEVHDGEFISRGEIPEEIEQRQVTNSTLYSVREIGLLDDPESDLEKIS